MSKGTEGRHKNFNGVTEMKLYRSFKILAKNVNSLNLVQNFSW